MEQHALLIGVGHFSRGLPAVDYVVEDVDGISDVLIQSMDVLPENIVKLINENATEAAILSEINNICNKVHDGDRVILYFSTHGRTVYGTSFLAAFDASNSETDNDGWIWLSHQMTPLINKGCNVVAFLDACHSTQLSREFSILQDQELVLPSCSCPGQYKIIFGAAGENERAYSDFDFKHGCWTYYLIEALSGRAKRSFADNSRRITANSLQTYLCDSVSARQSALGRKQTPYMDAVYPVDILIVEHPQKEDDMIKVKDIYFGEIDADSEKDNVPSIDYIIKNFYDLNSIASDLTTNSSNAIQIIIGNKGTGKTFLGKYLEVTHDNVIFQSVKRISFSDIQNLTSAQADDRGKYVQSWIFALYSILSCLIIKNEKPGWEKFHDLLKAVHGNQINTILKAFPAGTKQLLDKKLKRGIKLGEQFGYSPDEIVRIDDINLIFTSLFNDFYSSENLYFLIDGLDEQIRGKISQDQQKYLLDLFGAVDQSREELTNVKIVLLFRNDLLQTISGEANLNKIISARSRTLSWLSTNSRYKETPLYQFLEKRIATSIENTEGKTVTKLEEVLPSQISSENTWTWILRLTTHTPRDVISFFKKCQELSGENVCLTEANLWDATRPYSDYLWKEFRDVLAGTALANKDEHLQTLLDNLVQTNNLKYNSRFDYKAFSLAYQKTPGVQDVDLKDVLKILYETGIMCVHTNLGTFWYFRENPIQFDIEIWKESKFEIHTGLWKKFHIW